MFARHKGVLERLTWSDVAPYAVCIIASLYFGTIVSIVPVTLNYHAVLSDCSRIEAADGCAAYPQCEWYRGVCAHRDMIGVSPLGTCANLTDQPEQCVGHCTWDRTKKRCAHLPGWSPLQAGLFAGAAVSGGLPPTMLGSSMINRFYGGSLRYAGMVSGMVALVGCILMVVGFSINDPADHSTVGTFWLLIIGCLLTGWGYGSGAVTGPLHGAAIAPPHRRTSVAILFGLAISVGHLTVAALAFAVDPERLPPRLAQKLYVCVNVLQIICAVLTVVFSHFAQDVVLPSDDPPAADDLRVRKDNCKSARCTSTKPAGVSERELRPSQNSVDDVYADPRAPSESAGSAAGSPPTSPSAEYDYFEESTLRLPAGMPRTWWGRLSVGVLLSMGLQLTGVAAVFTYAPRLAASAGFSPLAGNLILMTLNAISTFGAVPTAKRFRCRPMFLASALATSMASLAAGIPSLIAADAEPHSHTFVAMEVLIFLGALGVLVFYELGMGTSFYVLAQASFPPKERQFGTGIAVGTQLVCQVFINTGFEPLQSVLSGDGSHGAQGGEHRGQGWIFVSFGVIGIVVTALLYKLLHPFDI